MQNQQNMRSFQRQAWLISLSAIFLLAGVAVFGILGQMRFNEVESAWSSHTHRATDIGNAMSALEQNIGYGGFIHNFKNMVLRRDLPRYQSALDQNIAGLTEALDKLDRLLLLPEDKAAVAQLRATFEEYTRKYHLVAPLIAAGKSVDGIDTVVNVSDTAALLARAHLVSRASEREFETEQQAQAIQEQAMRFMRLGGVMVIFAILAATVILIAFLQKITRANAIIKDTQLRLDRLLDSSPDPMLSVAEDGHIVRANLMAGNFFGYSTQELLTMNIEQLIPERFRSVHGRHRSNYFIDPHSQMMGGETKVLLALTRDGREPDVEISLSHSGEGAERLAIITIRDMTERNNAADALRQLSERLSLATRAGGVGIWDFDVVNNTLTWDDQMFALYGVGREQFGGVYNAWRAGLHPEDAARGDLEINKALRGEIEFNTEFRVVHPDGAIRYIRAMATVQRDAQGEPLRMIGTNWDITEQVQNRLALLAAKQKAEDAYAQQHALQDELVQSEKLAALGGMVAGIAHEVNTPVGITLSAATHLDAETQKAGALYQAGELTEEGLTEYFATAKQASQLVTLNARRAAELIQSFKQVAVDQAGGEQRRFDLADYLHEIQMSMGLKLKKRNVEVKIDCPKGILINGLPGALSQVLTNLIMNSLLHAFEAGQSGHIEIAARTKGDDIEIVYHDDGKGILFEFQHKIFDPFFTTTRGRGGSGLGLHIVYNIITQTLKGSIEMESAPLQGTTFILHFPIVLTN